MKVFVIMGNDFPDAVLSNEAEANAYVEGRKSQDLERRAKDRYAATIYWRAYEFRLDAKGPRSAGVGYPDNTGKE